MARYQYAGPGPDESSGELIRPGDVREFDQEPDWGPWELLDEPEAEAAAGPRRIGDDVPIGGGLPAPPLSVPLSTPKEF